MNVIITDIIIIALLSLSIYKGIKNGLIKEALSLISFFASAFLANAFKGYFALFFLDLIKLPPEFSSLDSIRIMIAQTISFLILWFVFNLIFKLVISLFAKIEMATVSAVTVYFAAALSFLKTYFVIFVVLFVISFMGNDFSKTVNQSFSAKMILYNTPLLSDYANGTGDELKEFITNVNQMIENGEAIDFADLDFVSDFIKNNPGLITSFISPEMISDLIGDEFNLRDLNKMMTEGNIDPEVINTLVSDEVVDLIVESDALDLRDLRTLYDNNELDSQLIKTLTTPKVVQTLISEGIFTKEELLEMYNNGVIEGTDILKILEEN